LIPSFPRARCSVEIEIPSALCPFDYIGRPLPATFEFRMQKLHRIIDAPIVSLAYRSSRPVPATHSRCLRAVAPKRSGSRRSQHRDRSSQRRRRICLHLARRWRGDNVISAALAGSETRVRVHLSVTKNCSCLVASHSRAVSSEHFVWKFCVQRKALLRRPRSLLHSARSLSQVRP
jgi:hypothetical protein